MKDFLITLLGVAVISALMFTKESGIVENWGTNPPLSVSVQKEMAISRPSAQNSAAAQALGFGGAADNTYAGPMVGVPMSLQSMVAPVRAGSSNIKYGQNITLNTPGDGLLGASAHALTYGASNVEKYDDPERFEPISSAAAAAGGMQFEKAQALADQGLVKAAQPSMSIKTAEGEVEVTVYDRLMYSNSRSRLYGQGDPIRGDIGCIVPIKSDWFRPSVRPNIDLRPGAMTIMGGIDNETPRELRALQSAYSAGTSRSTTDAYANAVNPAMAQKSISTGGGAAAPEIHVSAFS
jgi:hypothetical protein